MKLRLHSFSRHPLLSLQSMLSASQLHTPHNTDPDHAFAHASCSYVLHSAISLDRNARRCSVYSSMNADKKASLLLARRTASEQCKGLFLLLLSKYVSSFLPNICSRQLGIDCCYLFV